MKELRRMPINHQVKERDPIYENNEVIEIIEQLDSIRAAMKKFGAIGYSPDHDEHYGNLSARFLKNKFLCTATQTSGLETILPESYPLVYDVDSDLIVHSIGHSQSNKPSVECSTHDGFYRGNKGISFVVHGHYPLLFDYYKDKSQEAVLMDQRAKYGTAELREEAIKAAQSPVILKNETDHGRWGLAIPLGHPPGFFIVGESSKALRQGLFSSISHAAICLHNKATKELARLELERL